MADNLIRTTLGLLTPKYILNELKENPLTTVFLAIFLIVFIIEIYVAYRHSVDEYRYWFVTTPEISPGLLFGVISHSIISGYRDHVILNGFLLLVFGRLIENKRSREKYIVLFFIFGYLAIFSQLGHELITNSSNSGTMGASGSITAFAAINAVWMSVRMYRDEISDGGLLLLLTSIAFMLMWIGMAVIPSLGAPNTGDVAHTVGIVLGILYGIATVGDVWE